MDAQHPDGSMCCGENRADQVVDVQMRQPLLVETAACLFLGRHQVFVRDDAGHAIGQRALHPQVTAMPFLGPGLIALGQHQIGRAFQQAHPDVVRVQLDHGAGRTQSLRNPGCRARPQGRIHRRVVE
eukprot:647-Eustigmatos_ZCMA.PRE.1